MPSIAVKDPAGFAQLFATLHAPRELYTQILLTSNVFVLKNGNRPSFTSQRSSVSRVTLLVVGRARLRMHARSSVWPETLS
jgi:hypothetical protein